MKFSSRIKKEALSFVPFGVRQLAILRHELVSLRTRFENILLPYRRAQIRYIRQLSQLKVNIGSGGHSPEGWIGVDVRKHSKSIPWDIRFGLPFSDHTVELIYASHVLEHLDFATDARRFLEDCVRCLLPHGRIRIVVPDLQKFIHAYLSVGGISWLDLGITPSEKHPTGICVLNHVFHMGGEHLFGYDYETIEYLLKICGFTHVSISRFRASDHFNPDLDLDIHQRYSIYVEAWR